MGVSSPTIGNTACCTAYERAALARSLWLARKNDADEEFWPNRSLPLNLPLGYTKTPG